MKRHAASLSAPLTRALAGALALNLAACDGTTSVVGARPDATTDDIASDSTVPDVADVLDASDAGDASDAADGGDAGDASDVSDAADASDGSDASDAGDAGDVSDAPALVSTTRAVVECGTVCARPMDAIPNGAGTEVFFTAFTAMGEAGVFRATVPAPGAAPATPTLVASGGGMEFPIGIAISRDDATLYVADPSTDGADADTGAVFSIPAGGGTPTRINTGVELLRPQGIAVSADGESLLVTGQRLTSTDLLRALFRVPRAGGAGVVLTTDLVDPSGVSQDSMGYITLFDARRGGPNAGTAFIFSSPRVTELAVGVEANHPAGASLAINGRSALISGTVADTGDGLLTWVGADGRATSPASLSTGMSTPLGLHRARTLNTWAVADEAAGESGQVFLVTVAP